MKKKLNKYDFLAINRRMKCCENCRKHRNVECSEDKKFYARTQRQCDDWELAD